MALLIWLCGAVTAVAAEKPPRLPKGAVWLAGVWAGPLTGVLTYTGGRWRAPLHDKGRLSPWVGLVQVPSVKKSARPKGPPLMTVSLKEVMDTPPDGRLSGAFSPAASRPGGWLLLRNPAPVALTPGLVTRWDNLLGPGETTLVTVLAKSGKAVNPNAPTWPPGELLWVKTGVLAQPLPDKGLSFLPLDPLMGDDTPPPAKNAQPCAALRLAYELEALSSATGIASGARALRVCEILGVLSAQRFALLNLPPAHPDAGRHGRALSMSVTLPEGADHNHPTVARFGPAFVLGEGAGARVVFRSPITEFWWRDSLLMAGLPAPPLPQAAPDGSFVALQKLDDTGVTLSFHQRHGQCETTCLYEAVCLLRIHRGRVAARAGLCEREF